MPCSSKSVQERLPSVSSLLNGGPFDQNEEYDAEFNVMVKGAGRKIVKEKTKKKKLEEQRKSDKEERERDRVFSATWEVFF